MSTSGLRYVVGSTVYDRSTLLAHEMLSGKRRGLCHYLEGLKFIGYSEGKLPESVPKAVFASFGTLAAPEPVRNNERPGTSSLKVVVPARATANKEPCASDLQVTIPKQPAPPDLRITVPIEVEPAQMFVAEKNPKKRAARDEEIATHAPRPPSQRAEHRASSPRRAGHRSPRPSSHHSAPTSKRSGHRSPPRRAEPQASSPRRAKPQPLPRNLAASSNRKEQGGSSVPIHSRSPPRVADGPRSFPSHAAHRIPSPNRSGPHSPPRSLFPIPKRGGPPANPQALFRSTSRMGPRFEPPRHHVRSPRSTVQPVPPRRPSSPRRFGRRSPARPADRQEPAPRRDEPRGSISSERSERKRRHEERR